MSHKGTYIVTFNTSNRSNIGLEIFENMLKAFCVVAGNQKKSYRCTIEKVDGQNADILKMMQGEKAKEQGKG